MSKLRYRVMLSAEDGQYVLKDSFLSEESAEQYAAKKSKNYGEGQRLFVESYNPFFNY